MYMIDLLLEKLVCLKIVLQGSYIFVYDIYKYIIQNINNNCNIVFSFFLIIFERSLVILNCILICLKRKFFFIIKCGKCLNYIGKFI